MNDRELKEWGEKLLHEVGHEWLNARGNARRNYPDVKVLEGGWGVFYSPIRMHPELMIIGINPGGDKDSFDEAREYHLPTEHEYFDESLDVSNKPRNGYPLAKKTVKLFGDMNLTHLLRESVKLNLLFFRSRSVRADQKDAWHRVPEDLREDLESFCKTRVLEIIEVLKPRTILAESKDTYHKLRDFLQGRGLLPIKEFPDLPRCYVKTQYAGLTLIGIDHLTGAWIRTEDQEKAKALLAADLCH